MIMMLYYLFAGWLGILFLGLFVRIFYLMLRGIIRLAVSIFPFYLLYRLFTDDRVRY